MERSVLFYLNVLDQLSMLCYELPKISKFLQEFGEEQGVVRVVGLQVEPQSVNDTFLNAFDM